MSSLIGEAFVRIRPDLTGFRAETQAAVRSSLISAPKIRVAPDTSQFAADATAGVRTALSSLSSGVSTGGLKIKPDTSQFAREAEAGVAAAVASIPASSRKIALLPDLSGFTRQVTRAGGLFTQAFGGGAVASAVARGGVAAGVIGLGAAMLGSVKAAATFEKSLNVLQATAGATDAQMKAISETARQLGADIHLPAVSASDAATAMLELSKAGLSVQDAMKGARGTLELATAGQLAVGDAAKIIGTTLNTFALQGTQAAHVADLLAGAANHSAGEVSDFAFGLAQAGTVAKQFGLSADQTVGALGLLAKNGILAAEGGTSLKTLLLQLIPASKQASDAMDALKVNWHDQAGNILPLNAILDSYRTQLAKLPPALREQTKAQIVGQEGIRAFNILLNEGSGAIDKAAAAYGRQNNAQKLATAQTVGLSGSVQGLLSQVETLATDLGQPLLKPLTEVTNEFSKGVGKVDAWTKSIENATAAIPGFSVGLRDLIKNLPGGDRGLKSLIPSFLTGPSLVDIAKPFAQFGEATKKIKETDKALVQAVADGKILREQLPKDLQVTLPPAFGSKLGIQGLKAPKLDKADKADAINDAEQTGRDVAIALARGERSAAQDAVTAAQETLKRVIAAGKEQVAQAIAQAQQQATSIGSDLAARASAAIDVGPIASRVTELTDQLAAAQAAHQRAQLQQGVRAAQSALNQAVAASKNAGNTVIANLQAQAKRIEAQVKAQSARIDAQIQAITRRQAARQIAEQRASLNQALADANRQLAQGRKAVADAQNDLNKAKRDLISINQAGKAVNQLGQTAGPDGAVITLPKFEQAPGQKEAIAEFLKPLQDNVTSAQDSLAGMQQAVQDAAAAIVEFNRQTREQAQIDALERKKAAGEAKAAAAAAKVSAAEAAKAVRDEAVANRQRITDARNALKEAKVALRDFNTQAVITQLQKAVEAQKKAVTQGIADIVNQFNQGRISLPKANAQIAALLGAQGVNYRTAGAKLGSAWRDGFLAQLANLRKQMEAIIAGPFKPGAGLAQTPVSPAQAAAQARAAVGQARADLQKDQLKEQKASNKLLDQIRKEVANGTATGKRTEQNTRPRRNPRRTPSAVNSARGGSGGPSGVTGPYDPRCRTGRCP